jgi:hypothetical protein
LDFEDGTLDKVNSMIREMLMNKNVPQYVLDFERNEELKCNDQIIDEYLNRKLFKSSVGYIPYSSLDVFKTSEEKRILKKDLKTVSDFCT